jgi:hypothetical protein
LTNSKENHENEKEIETALFRPRTPFVMGQNKPTREDIILAFKELDAESEEPVGAKALTRSKR